MGNSIMSRRFASTPPSGGDAIPQDGFAPFPAAAFSPGTDAELAAFRLEAISAVCYRCLPTWRIAPRVPGDDMVFLVLGGRCLLTVGDARVEGRTGDVLFLPAGVQHQAEGFPQDPLEVIVIHYLASTLTGASLANVWSWPLRLTPAHPAVLRALLAQACREYHLQPAGWKLALNALVTQAFLNLLRQSGIERRQAAPAGRVMAGGRVAPALHAMRGQLAAPLAIPELARLCGLSEPHFRRLFRRATGVTPVRYLQRLRVEEARLLLRQTDRTVADIAGLLGYAEPSHFSAVFHRHMHLWPGEYRKGGF
jgi:AraC family transcriptional regulator